MSGLAAELFPQADDVLSGEVGSPERMAIIWLLGSVSREAEVMLGEVMDAAAAQARGALARPILTAVIGGRGWEEARG